MGPGLDPMTVRDFGTALLIGALLGLEREKHKAQEGSAGIGGIRTFILFAQAGAVGAWLSRTQQSPWLFAAAVLAVAALVAVGYVVNSRAEGESLGLTTEIAAVVTCLLGGMVLFGFPEIAVALAIVTSALLAYKQPLHALVSRIGTEDLFAGVKLLIATFVVLPLLPDRVIDPWGALNPYRLWWLVVLISGLSLVGYAAVRWLGPAKGTLVTGLAGGLVSSTAVTLAFARRSREEAGRDASASDALAAGMMLAWTIMFARVVVLVAVVFAPLVGRLILPMSLMAAAALAATLVFYRASAASATGGPASPLELSLRNPFSLSWAVRFAALFAAVLLFVKLAEVYVPQLGVYVVAAVAGLTDVDAIALSMTGFARDGGEAGTAVGAMVIAAMSNTLVKGGLTVALGSPALRRRVVPATLAVLVAGALVLIL